LRHQFRGGKTPKRQGEKKNMGDLEQDKKRPGKKNNKKYRNRAIKVNGGSSSEVKNREQWKKQKKNGGKNCEAITKKGRAQARVKMGGRRPRKRTW